MLEWLKASVHKGRSNVWIGLGVLWIVGFIGALSRFIMAYYQVQISADLGIGRGFISLSWSTNLFIAALCAPLGGWLVDRFGAKRVMILSTLLSVAGTGTVYLGHIPLVFFTGYGIIAGLAGIGASTTYVLLFGWFDKHRAKAIALIQSASSIGLAVCTPIFAQNSWISWKVTFLASCILGLVVTLPLILLFIRNPRIEGASKTGKGTTTREGKTTGEGKTVGANMRREGNTADTTVPGERKSRLKVLGRTQLAILLTIGFALFTCGFNMGTVEMNLVAIHQEANVPNTTIAAAMAVLGVMEIAGSFAFGFLLDRWNKPYVMFMLYGIRVFSFMILLAHFPASPVLFALSFGITYLGAVPGGLMIADQLGGAKGRMVGILLLFHQGGGILGALLGGILYDYMRSYQLLIAVDAGLALAAAAGYVMIRRYKNDQAAVPGETQTDLPAQT
ncbi:MFS transporter [Paenibacillus sp. J22TS3]|uniref:MFS transporter n=1 Tax=Paenibacillus sp. J22TS3 TaxID=2807192 RepID=UPI001B13801E|nr:MFS transporter [Paenibacillus sp. J22TS3]GIP22031.1 MFS transporter [Paenibacillus sp. J22TS3]